MNGTDSLPKSKCLEVRQEVLYFSILSLMAKMLTQRQPKQILEELDRLLEENTLSPSYTDGMNDPDYTLQHKQMQKAGSKNRENNINYVVEQASEMIAANQSKTFRLGSIGCGDGSFDKEALTQLLEKYPNLDLHYIGVDVNELSCQIAREQLSSLKGVQFEILAKDFQHVRPADIEPCDLVIAVHVLYYVASLKTALSCALKLTKQSGCLMIVNAHRYPLNEIAYRFWLQEHNRPLWYTHDIKSVLEELGIAYHLRASSGPIDISNLFRSDFQSPSDLCVINFLAHTKLDRYPPTVTQKCIEYFYSIAEGKPETVVLTLEADIFYITI